MNDTWHNMSSRYESGEIPWDHELPPPEVLDLIPTLRPGRALDLGCGYGRASIFIAQAGWQVDAVDFIPLAIEGARTRAEAAGVASAINFHVGDISDLHFLDGPYDFALDVGCAHSLDAGHLAAYHAGLRRLLAPEGQYLLFAHLNEPGQPDDRPHWMDEQVMLGLFADGFELLEAVPGITQVGDRPPWPSAWYHFIRRSD